MVSSVCDAAVTENAAPGAALYRKGGRRRVSPRGAARIAARDVLAVQQNDAVPILLQVLCEVTGMKFAAVARCNRQRFVLCVVRDEMQVGLKTGSVFDPGVAGARSAPETPIVIEQAGLHPDAPRLSDRRACAFESYVQVPIMLGGGRCFGILCALDSAPARLPAAALAMFRHFAALIARDLDSTTVRAEVETSLRDERADGELREEFIAILGHDLRNPLQAIFATSDLLARRVKDPQVAAMATRIKVNARRMSSLVDDVFDFARGRLAGGIGLHLAEIEDLNAGLTSVVEELLDGQPNRQIDYHFSVDRAVNCDLGRVQQVASNLIGNALTHGATGRPIKVTAVADEHDLVFEVWNAGEPIPPESLAKVFDPFWRQTRSKSREGLGLGLHICAQIIHSHGGKLSVTSTREAGTTFTARVPLHMLPTRDYDPDFDEMRAQKTA